MVIKTLTEISSIISAIPAAKRQIYGTDIETRIHSRNGVKFQAIFMALP
jgi:hypothetical protein